MALFGLKVPCWVCGEPAVRWCDAVGFIHVGCVPDTWFAGWQHKKIQIDPGTKEVAVVDSGGDSMEQHPPCPF